MNKIKRHKRKIFAGLTFLLVVSVINILHYRIHVAMRDGVSFFMPIASFENVKDSANFLKITYVSPIPGTEVLSERGKIVITIDRHTRTGTFERLYKKGEKLEPGEYKLSYRIKRSEGLTSQNIETNIFFASDRMIIPHGKDIKDYKEAVYAILKVGPDGTGYLIGLADKDFKKLGVKES